MSPGILLKRKPAAPDLTAITSLDDMPTVRATAESASEAQTSFDALEARARALDLRAQTADPLTQLEARLALRALVPDLQMAEVRVLAARNASGAARASGRDQLLAAHRHEFEARLKRSLAKWGEAVAENAATLEWLHNLSAVIGYGALSHWFETLPVALRPGGPDEWQDAARRCGGWDV